MATKKRRYDWFRPLLFTLLVVVGPALLYFVVHVQGQESLFTKRVFRRLAATATKLEDEIESATKIMGKAFGDVECDKVGDDIEKFKSEVRSPIEKAPKLKFSKWLEEEESGAAGQTLVRTADSIGPKPQKTRCTLSGNREDCPAPSPAPIPQHQAVPNRYAWPMAHTVSS